MSHFVMWIMPLFASVDSFGFGAGDFCTEILNTEENNPFLRERRRKKERKKKNIKLNRLERSNCLYIEMM